jgi:hypothetical protein
VKKIIIAIQSCLSLHESHSHPLIPLSVPPLLPSIGCLHTNREACVDLPRLFLFAIGVDLLDEACVAEYI